MIPDNIRQLEALLRNALNSVVVVGEEASDHMDVPSYVAHLERSMNSYDRSSRLAIGTYTPTIGDSVTRDAVMSVLREEMDPYLLNDRLQSATFALGHGRPEGYPLSRLLANLLDRSFTYGPQAAAHAFFDCIQRAYAPLYDYFLISGMRVAEEIEVFDGVWLLPPPHAISTLPSGIPEGGGGMGGSTWGDKTLLRVDHEVAPIFWRPSNTIGTAPELRPTHSVRPSSEEVSRFDPYRYCQSLSLVCKSPIQPAIEWTAMGEYEIFDLRLHAVTVYSFQPQALAEVAVVDVLAAQTDEARDLYSAMQTLPPGTQEVMDVPISRWVKSMSYSPPVDKMIDLGIALESLYLSTDSSATELRFRLALRASWHLGSGLSQRIELMNEFKSIYKLRSDAVHQGKLPDRVRVGSESLTTLAFLERAQELCAKSILQIIWEGRLPNWDRMVLGGDSE